MAVPGLGAPLLAVAAASILVPWSTAGWLDGALFGLSLDKSLDLPKQHLLWGVPRIHIENVGPILCPDKPRGCHVAGVHADGIVDHSGENRRVSGFGIREQSLNRLASVAVHVLRHHQIRIKRVRDDIHPCAGKIIVDPIVENGTDASLSGVDTKFRIPIILLTAFGHFITSFKKLLTKNRVTPATYAKSLAERALTGK